MRLRMCEKESISLVGDSSWSCGHHRIEGKVNVRTTAIYHQSNTNTHTLSIRQCFNLIVLCVITAQGKIPTGSINVKIRLRVTEFINVSFSLSN